MMANASSYDAWYRTSRGRWIGETEYRLLYHQMAPRPGETILDVGCGTGYFSRRFAHDGHFVAGLDLDPAVAAFAHASMHPPLPCVVADMTALPFADRSFDCTISVTALCFVADELKALKEIIRVARRRFALGLLNRASLLHLVKRGSTGSYAGARWHNPSAIAAMLSDLPVEDVAVATAIFVPWGGTLAQALERIAPNNLPWGSFIAVSGSITPKT
ncbi:MAG: class I SAM-dependent methyltransferase [Gammaproteobacteria bacterium]|nr:class I SAM-dependent methyltransferase [Rhodocyclaceae bacterium]MBU3908671.1 class I SAM-dependent methyltransferase [Gammaproteobacteria bacterium]MBU3988964.1 class I SAM-dependent methyltransferase [Gammaproteobacteria bacterium]MBU4004699.1 class I SAM-dependent methyltransferase [Gammaproteobacteria bacterium]MBU4021302.1 class I SAM-dependent methyltransferase [Gammaproteobacteria bacterium]